MGRNSKKTDDKSILRNSKLMESRTAKMATPYIISTLSVALVSLIDSPVAGRSIGAVALAAVAATAPIFSIEQILHCLLGFGIDKLMIQEVGKGNRKAANRIFGAVLVSVAVVYALVFGLIIIFERPILSLIGIDPSLRDAVVAYSLPLIITMPIFEVFLCIERAFRVDGRARLFAIGAFDTRADLELKDIQKLYRIEYLGEVPYSRESIERYADKRFACLFAVPGQRAADHFAAFYELLDDDVFVIDPNHGKRRLSDYERVNTIRVFCLGTVQKRDGIYKLESKDMS